MENVGGREAEEKMDDGYNGLYDRYKTMCKDSTGQTDVEIHGCQTFGKKLRR